MKYLIPSKPLITAIIWFIIVFLVTYIIDGHNHLKTLNGFYSVEGTLYQDPIEANNMAHVAALPLALLFGSIAFVLGHWYKSYQLYKLKPIK